MLNAVIETDPPMLTQEQGAHIRNHVGRTAKWLDGKSRGAWPNNHPLGAGMLPRWADIGRLTWTKNEWRVAFPDLVQGMALLAGQHIVKGLISMEMNARILPEKAAA